MDFLEKYPVKTHEVIHYPLMVSDLLKRYRIPGIHHASLSFIYSFCSFFKIKEGTVRTNLTRMKKAGDITSYKEGERIRYEAADLQKERMKNVLSRKKKRPPGFILAVYSFQAEQEKERVLARSLLEYTGFVRIAQNSYINSRENIQELKKNLEKHELMDYMFLFEIDKISHHELSKLSIAWDVENKNKFLQEFFTDLKTFFEQWNGSAGDWVNRLGAAWIVYVMYVQNREIPLPIHMLPKDYPYAEIEKYMNQMNKRNYRQFLAHIRSVNQ